MKKTILFSFLIIAGFLSACKKQGFLDNKADTAINETYVFSDSLRTLQFLTRIYTDIGFSYRKWRWNDHGNTEQTTDDAEYNLSGVGQMAVILYSGTISPSNFPSPMTDFWDLPYANIRRVNLLLAKLPEAPLSAGKKKRMVAEARFLRAWYYHQLMAAFGGVPIIGEKVFTITNVVNQPRSTYAECVEYVVKELDEAAADLPLPYTVAPGDQQGGYEDLDYGRVTRGACLGLKSRLLLYAASPLFNYTEPYVASSPERLKAAGYTDYSVTRWQRAADAAEAVINSGYYSLVKDNATAPGWGFYNLFLTRVNEEFMFIYNRPNNRDWEGFYLPSTRGGNRYVMPSHNLAAAFPMKNGKAVNDPASGYSATNPYANRDPRFNYSIIHNGSLVWLTSSNSKQPVYTYLGTGQTADAFSDNSSTTGYFTRKMVNTENASQTERPWVLMRYAEILLNYAEAINETGQPALAYPKLIELRDRAGIDPGTDNLYGMKPDMTQGEMREFIRNERRIELAFEDHRYNDIRRWRIAMQVNNGFNERMRITRVGSTTPHVFTYQVVPTIRRHNFRPEMHLLPIPAIEVRRMPAMVQNPGW